MVLCVFLFLRVTLGLGCFKKEPEESTEHLGSPLFVWHKPILFGLVCMQDGPCHAVLDWVSLYLDFPAFQGSQSRVTARSG